MEFFYRIFKKHKLILQKRKKRTSSGVEEDKEPKQKQPKIETSSIREKNGQEKISSSKKEASSSEVVELSVNVSASDVKKVVSEMNKEKAKDDAAGKQSKKDVKQMGEKSIKNTSHNILSEIVRNLAKKQLNAAEAHKIKEDKSRKSSEVVGKSLPASTTITVKRMEGEKEKPKIVHQRPTSPPKKKLDSTAILGDTSFLKLNYSSALGGASQTAKSTLFLGSKPPQPSLMTSDKPNLPMLGLPLLPPPIPSSALPNNRLQLKVGPHLNMKSPAETGYLLPPTSVKHTVLNQSIRQIPNPSLLTKQNEKK